MSKSFFLRGNDIENHVAVKIMVHYTTSCSAITAQTSTMQVRKAYFVPVPLDLLVSVATSCLIGIETKGGFPLLRNFFKNRGDV